MLITSTIPNLINGVSQQPATLRLPSQAELQVNWLSTVSDGLRRRPGSRHVARLSTNIWDDAFLHTINRDRTEQYLLVIRGGTLRVFEARTGVERVVNAPSGFGYLAPGDKNDFRAVTVADFTFIVNRNKVAQMDPALSPVRPNQTLVYFRAGNYARQYSVTIAGIKTGVHQTPDGSVAAHAEQVRTTFIAQKVLEALTNDTALADAGFTVVRQGDILLITRDTAAAYTVTGQDDAGGTNMSVIGPLVQRFSDLPKNGINGFITEIAGDNASSFDNYHVEYNKGVWKETLLGGQRFRIDGVTMPHVLVREADGTFTFRPSAWDERTTGDVNKMPFPSFIGRRINDVFFYRNRLGLLADENVIMSKQGEFFSYFRDTATTLIDTDPIDIAITSTRVSILTHALPFNKSLLLFSGSAQFILEGGDVLTAETAYLAQATEFDSSFNCRPVGVGQYVYFAVPRGSFTGIREYFVQTGNEQNDAVDVTSHVPSYLPSGVFKLAASSAEDMIIALTSAQPGSIYVYKYFFTGEGKLQSSWSLWSMGEGSQVLSAEFLESELFLVIAREGGTYIERVDIESGALDPQASFPYHVDQGFLATDITFADGLTTITLPYPTQRPLWVFIAGGDTARPEGQVLTHTRPNTSQVTLEGDFRGRRIFIGTQVGSRYRFSTFFVRTNEGSGVTANDDGRLQIRRLAVNFTDTGFFQMEVTPRSRPRSTSVFSGKHLGATTATIGVATTMSEGRFTTPVMCRNRDAQVDIFSNHFLPCSFTSAEWEATYHGRGRRV